MNKEMQLTAKEKKFIENIDRRLKVVKFSIIVVLIAFITFLIFLSLAIVSGNSYLIDLGFYFVSIFGLVLIYLLGAKSLMNLIVKITRFPDSQPFSG
jgi:hypothetical protein